MCECVIMNENEHSTKHLSLSNGSLVNNFFILFTF